LVIPVAEQPMKAGRKQLSTSARLIASRIETDIADREVDKIIAKYFPVHSIWWPRQS